MIHFYYQPAKICFRFCFLALFAFSIKLQAQTDTLHLYYRGLETKVLDSNETKIAKWAKSLNGRKVNIDVLAYYQDPQFKKYSVQRCEELYIILNRKARTLIDIKSQGPKKGAKSQRSTVDVVYTFQDTPAAVSTPTTPTKGKKESAAAPTESLGATSDANPVGEEKPAKTEKPAKAEKSNKHEYIMDTTYVNGVMKVKKIKVKK